MTWQHGCLKSAPQTIFIAPQARSSASSIHDRCICLGERGTRITCFVLAEVFGGRSRRDEIRPQTCACASMLGRFCAGSHVFERDATMAKRLSFYCDLCDKSYDFRSRYDRHLLSSTHRDLEGAIKLQNFSVPETQSDPCLLPSSTTESRSVSRIPVSLSSTQRRWHKMCTPSTG